MERKNGIYVFVIAVLAVALVAMSIGFAFSDINLQIDGGVTTKASSWDVHFDQTKNINKTATTTVASAAAVSQANPLTATYSVTLNKVGDYYEFDIDVINSGDFDAKLKTITLTNTDSVAYLTHSVTYNSTTYTNATNTISNAPTLSAGDGTETIHVKVMYDEPADEDDLPKTDVTATYSVTLVYTQVTS